MPACAICPGVTGRYGDMEGVWMEPVGAQVMMTFRVFLDFMGVA